MVLATSTAISGLIGANKGMAFIKRHKLSKPYQVKTDIIADSPTIYAASHSTQAALNIDKQTKQKADRCVMCGLCLPHCPTYIKTQNEAESPRGRISLIMALSNGQLEPDIKLHRHLDNCLLCRACEIKCPSGVQFGEIMDGARHALGISKPESEQRASLTQLSTDKKRQHREATTLWLANKTGLRALGRNLGITKAIGIERFEQLAPNIKRPHGWKDYYPAQHKHRGDVALFTGCVSNMLDQRTLDDAITVLTACGYGVHIPAAQTCCGALHQHTGNRKKAKQLAQQNIQAFSALQIEAIISCATGCGGHMSEYQALVGAAIPTRDINTFLCDIASPQNMTFRPLKKRVAVHEPCSLRNVLKESHAIYSLLAHIPELELLALAGNNQCCGGAGSYMIDHPDMADKLRNDKLDALQTIHPDILATANIGCALHIAAGMRQTGIQLEVLHPVSLLARQLVA